MVNRNVIKIARLSTRNSMIRNEVQKYNIRALVINNAQDNTPIGFTHG